MSEIKGMEIYMAVEPQEDGSFFIKKSTRDGSLAVFDEDHNAVRQVKINDDSTELREGLILSSERKKKIERQIERLTTDRQNAISLMSKSWQHDSEKQDDLMTRYVTMAENQFKRKDEEIERLTAISTNYATLNDERYELLEKQKSDIEKMLDQLFHHENVDAWLVCKMNDMLDDVNHQLDKPRTEADK